MKKEKNNFFTYIDNEGNKQTPVVIDILIIPQSDD